MPSDRDSNEALEQWLKDYTPRAMEVQYQLMPLFQQALSQRADSLVLNEMIAPSLAFLRLNGVRIHATDDDLVDLVVGMAEGRLSKADVAVFLREHATETA